MFACFLTACQPACLPGVACLTACLLWSEPFVCACSACLPPRLQEDTKLWDGVKQAGTLKLQERPVGKDGRVVPEVRGWVGGWVTRWVGMDGRVCRGGAWVGGERGASEKG